MSCRSSNLCRVAFLMSLWLVALTLDRACAAQSVNSSEVDLSPAAQHYLNQVASQGLITTNSPVAQSNAIVEAEASKLVTVDALDDQHKLGIGDKVSFR